MAKVELGGEWRWCLTHLLVEQAACGYPGTRVLLEGNGGGIGTVTCWLRKSVGTLVHMSYSKEMVGDPQVVTTSPLPPPSVSPAIPLPGSLAPTVVLCVGWYAQSNLDASLRRVELGSLVSVPALKTNVGLGEGGMAVCPTLGLLVTSSHSGNTLSVFALPRSSGAGTCASGAGLSLVCTLGGAGSPAPMRFKFWDGGFSGWMAFTGPATARLLLVTNAGHDAVHVIDVVGRVHVGYVAAPGAIDGPRGVAARGSLVAVSVWIHCGKKMTAVTTWCSCSRAAEPAGQQCAWWVAASGVQAMQMDSCIVPTACGSLVTARGWRWRMGGMAV